MTVDRSRTARARLAVAFGGIVAALWLLAMPALLG